MPCYHPIAYHQDQPGGPVTINPALRTSTGVLPCGKCLGCKKQRAANWATRCMHEASLYKHNRFVTLTYSDDKLPPNGWLQLRDAQLWMKRLRKALPFKVRYFLTGEYGAITNRPHYHALLFNARFADEKPAGKTLLQSEEADKIWDLGQVRIGQVNEATAYYVAKYSIKSNCGHPSDDGEAPPAPFCTMSRRPGIGAPWLERYATDLQHGYVIRNGDKLPIPRAYMKKLPETIRDHIQHTRHQQDPRPAEPYERLEAAEVIHRAKIALYERTSL